MFRYGAFAALALFALVAVSAASAAPRVERDIPYVFGKSDPAALRRQSFDLYLPDVPRAPLVVFIHGGFWIESDDRYGIGERLAQVLVADGAAVAVVRYRLSPGVRHPVHLQDTALALATLKRLASRYGYDAGRLYLIGHSAGATMAASLALDPAHLREVGMKPADITGAVLVSGIYDLGPSGPLIPQHEDILATVFGTAAATRRTASPIAHVKAGPPLLLLAADGDFPRFAIDQRRFARALRGAGHNKVQDAIIPGQDHIRIVDLVHGKLMRALVTAFVGLKPLDLQTAALMRLRQQWQEPPFSTEPFWKSGVQVRSYPVDARLRAALEHIYEQNNYELRAYPLARFHAIDLHDYLATLDPQKVGQGKHLVLTNVRGERLYFTREQIAALRPQLVIGLDDERNLFRLNVLYQNKLEYSWLAEKPPVMARPLGAFIHFLKEPPPTARPTTAAAFSLSESSFRFSDSDPLAAIADVPADVRRTLMQTNACLSCHSFRGAGARAGHVAAHDGKLRGGFALALESYPPDAWRRFIFEPESSARLIGVRANPVERNVAQALHDIVAAERPRAVSPTR